MIGTPKHLSMYACQYSFNENCIPYSFTKTKDTALLCPGQVTV